MATLKEVAALSQVSVATVSYVLNGKVAQHHISPATAARVLSAAEECGYLLPKTKQADTGKKLRLLLLWPLDYPGQELMSVFNGIQKTRRVYTGSLDIAIKLFERGYLEQEWQEMRSKEYHAVILIALTPKDMAFVAQIAGTGVYVTINRRIKGCASVSIDNTAAGRMACDLLYSVCGTSISAVFEEKFTYGRSTRSQAFRERAKELGIPLEKHIYTCSVGGSYEEGYQYALDFIKKGSMTKGIFFTQDHTAVGFLGGMQKNGIVAGRDFWLLAAGLGSKELCRFSYPPITAIDLKMEETIIRAIETAQNILEKKTPVDTVITLEPGIIFRDTLPSPEW